jgi:Tol biopolymer transport system component/DNA-binding winged helix-turn-helix (wHTH) protein
MNMRGGRRRFGRWELDVPGLRLFKDGRLVRIQPQPLRMLVALTDRPGEIVTRDELRSRIWDSETFVEFDQGLGYCARQIRLVLADDANHPVYVETIKGRGYRFIAPVVEDAAFAPVSEGAGVPGLVEDAAATVVETAPSTAPTPAAKPNRARAGIVAVAVGAASIAVAAGFVIARRGHGAVPVYIQVTNFADAAVSPTVSPDGRMIAFIREEEPSFPIKGEVFAKRLPSSPAVQLTHDGLPKYGVAFSPDGSEVTYTVATIASWNTMAVPVDGGEPRLLLTNASGLSWLDSHRVLFAEFTGGIHMGLVTATDTRADVRGIYLPAHARGMAHVGVPSPDRKWVLVVEMGPDGNWQPCRVVPFDSSTSGVRAGPPGSCTAAVWSPDGNEMYFTVDTGTGSHIWRQRFPDGPAEQLTFGPGFDRGLAVSPDGRSLLTSLGSEESGLWIRDGSGERLLWSEGAVWNPSYSADGRTLYYGLLDLAADRPNELWMLDVSTGRSHPILQGFEISSYDVSEDGRWIVFAARSDDGRSRVWVASADHSSAPRRVSASNEDSPVFASGNRIVFRATEGKNNYLDEMDLDGSHRRRVRTEPIVGLRGRSANRRWVVSMVPAGAGMPVAIALIPLEGGAEQRVCPAYCSVMWSPAGDRVYVQTVEDARTGEALMVPLGKHDAFPALPQGGIASVAEGLSVPGSSAVRLPFASAVPGPTPDTFAYAKAVAHRNLFWVSLR